MRLKSRNAQKACLEPVLHILHKFQLPTPIWMGVMRGTNSKIKNPSKNTMRLYEGTMRLKSQNLGWHIYGPY